MLNRRQFFGASVVSPVLLGVGLAEREQIKRPAIRGYGLSIWRERRDSGLFDIDVCKMGGFPIAGGTVCGSFLEVVSNFVAFANKGVCCTVKSLEGGIYVVRYIDKRGFPSIEVNRVEDITVNGVIVATKVDRGLVGLISPSKRQISEISEMVRHANLGYSYIQSVVE